MFREHLVSGRYTTTALKDTCVLQIIAERQARQGDHRVLQSTNPCTPEAALSPGSAVNHEEVGRPTTSEGGKISGYRPWDTPLFPAAARTPPRTLLARPPPPRARPAAGTCPPKARTRR